MQKILLVDDSTTILMSVGEILHKAGYYVETAQNGRDALSKLQSEPRPDLIITDHNMPIMNGIQLTLETRKLPSMRFTPILFLTIESDPSIRDEGKRAGASGWLVKPVHGEQFLHVVRQVLTGI